MMAMAAPSPAPDDMPVVYGSARGFLMMVCMMQPPTASPNPAKNARMARGIMRSHMAKSSFPSVEGFPWMCIIMVLMEPIQSRSV